MNDRFLPRVHKYLRVDPAVCTTPEVWKKHSILKDVKQAMNMREHGIAVRSKYTVMCPTLRSDMLVLATYVSFAPGIFHLMVNNSVDRQILCFT